MGSAEKKKPELNGIFEDDIIKKYQILDDKCDIVLDKIKKRKKSKNGGKEKI